MLDLFTENYVLLGTLVLLTMPTFKKYFKRYKQLRTLRNELEYVGRVGVILADYIVTLARKDLLNETNYGLGYDLCMNSFKEHVKHVSRKDTHRILTEHVKYCLESIGNMGVIDARPN